MYFFLPISAFALISSLFASSHCLGHGELPGPYELFTTIASNPEYTAPNRIYTEFDKIYENMQGWSKKSYREALKKYHEMANNHPNSNLRAQDLFMISEYTAIAYERINSFLWSLPEHPPDSKTSELTKEEKENIIRILILQSALNKLQAYDQKAGLETVYRVKHYSDEAIEKYERAFRDHHKILEKGFVSTSPRENHFDVYQPPRGTQPNAWVTIQTFSGREISRFSLFGNKEAEVLIPFGRHFEVTEFKPASSTGKENVCHIYLQEIK